MITQMCLLCNERKKLTQSFFGRSSSNFNGFHRECIPCRNKLEKEKENKGKGIK